MEVELPDGTIAEFPHGTSDDTIKTVLRKRFPSQTQPEVPAPDPAVSMTLEQQKALALARARRRRHEAGGRTQDAPWYQQAAQAADDTVRLLASGITFGYADKLAGYLGGEGTEAERARTEQARERAGSAGDVAEFAGALATPVGLAGRGVSLAGRFGTGTMTGAKGLAARSSLMGVEGAGYGALTAAGNDQNIAEGAGYGVLGGVGGNLAGEALAAGVSKVAGVFNKKPTIPQLEDIQQAARDAYQRAEQAGIAYTPQAVDRLNEGIVKSLTDIGYDPALQPGAAAVVRRLQELQGQNVTLSGLDTLRKVASNGFIPGNASNNKAISSIIEKIDDVIGNPSAGDVLMGNAQAGAEALSEARSLWSRVTKANKVQDAVNRADLRAASTGSGGNVDNATRQNMRRLLENPRGFTADERAALETVVRGTPTQNALRLAGKLAPTGVVSGVLSGGAGFGILGPMGLALPLAGAGAKAIADRTTKKNVQKLADIILAGGSRAATAAPKNAVQRLTESKREAIARMLVGLGAYEAGTPAR
ncbi:hypothetical protein CN172_04335 [Sinorhizobium meliloti]|nr:hypothetical protein CN232_08845 [Sinorhizobium meliloti]RVH46576.1 hypothetical protein CN208_07100 [Sinorhizobium meliloti]RVK20208.1 hypothetical protein CN172_04335 [Sinorhizobium meliloti]